MHHSAPLVRLRGDPIGTLPSARTEEAIDSRTEIDARALRTYVDRVFPRGVERVERVRSGISTPVYRVRSTNGVFYVRLAETADASLAPEVLVHRLLRAQDVRVPDIVSFEPFEQALGRSVMVTTEVAGEQVAVRGVDAATRTIVREAGRDLAVINQLPIQGYGWIVRAHEATDLRAEYAGRDELTADYIATVEQLAQARHLTSRATAVARHAIEAWGTRSAEDGARLAHGDFDVSHIFQDVGRYTGIIDFGEIRGADRWYDLGHFHLHDGETLAGLVFSELVAGYGEVQPLPGDLIARVELEALVIGLMAWSRNIGKPEAAYTSWLDHRVHQLLERVSL